MVVPRTSTVTQEFLRYFLAGPPQYYYSSHSVTAQVLLEKIVRTRSTTTPENGGLDVTDE